MRVIIPSLLIFGLVALIQVMFNVNQYFVPSTHIVKQIKNTAPNDNILTIVCDDPNGLKGVVLSKLNDRLLLDVVYKSEHHLGEARTGFYGYIASVNDGTVYLKYDLSMAEIKDFEIDLKGCTVRKNY